MSRKNRNNKKKPNQSPKRPTNITLQQLEEQCNRFPNNPTVWKGLAAWHLQEHNFQLAHTAAEKAYSLDKSDPSIAAMYGAVVYSSGEISKAIQILQESFSTNPSNLQLCHDLALMLYRSNHHERSQMVSETGLKYHPECTKLIQLKASALKSLHKLEDAYALFKQLSVIDATNHCHWVDIGNIERDLGETDKSLESYQKAMELSGKQGAAYSNYVTTVHYHPEMSRADILEVCKQWQQQYAPHQIDTIHNHLEKDASKKIRIGLLSDGLKRSPVGQMITSVIEAYDKNNTEFIAFSTNDATDDLTDRLRRCCTQWHFIAQVLEDKLFKLIQDEKIDILIDLAGHNNGSRMSTIAKKPAPIIIKWVGGLINTTAVDAIDYLISDWIETPEGDDHYYTEKLIRMPNDYICYDPPHYAPPVSSLPATKNGFITFGCFNNPTKINKELLQNWAAIMHHVPNSKLYLKSFQFNSSALCERITQILLEFGISSDRLRLEGPSPHSELLAAYNDVDIALDTWPYSGGLTTCEAMLMGVPVVTLPGPTFAGRHSATHLINAGIPELVVDSWGMYQYRTLELASDLNSLSTIREHLRLVLLQSPVCEANHFATHLNDAIRAIWIRYCEGLKPTALHFSESGEVCITDLITLGNQSKEIIKKVQSNDSNEGLKSIENYREDSKKDAQINKIIALDHGGLLLTKSTTHEMLDADLLELIVFDPASNHLKNPLRNHPNVRYYPNIALGDGNPATLYACQSAEFTGTLKPAPNKYNSNDFCNSLQVLAELPIRTVALGSIKGLNTIDILLVDASSDITKIIENSLNKIKKIIILYDEKFSFKIYENQLNFAEIISLMNSHDFVINGGKSNDKDLLKDLAGDDISNALIFVKNNAYCNIKKNISVTDTSLQKNLENYKKNNTTNTKLIPAKQKITHDGILEFVWLKYPLIYGINLLDEGLKNALDEINCTYNVISNNSDIIHNITEKTGNKIIFTGHSFYNTTIKSHPYILEEKNLFDLYEKIPFAIVDDHSYADFMIPRTQNSPQELIIGSTSQNLLNEFEIISNSSIVHKIKIPFKIPAADLISFDEKIDRAVFIGKLYPGLPKDIRKVKSTIRKDHRLQTEEKTKLTEFINGRVNYAYYEPPLHYLKSNVLVLLYFDFIDKFFRNYYRELELDKIVSSFNKINKPVHIIGGNSNEWSFSNKNKCIFHEKLEYNLALDFMFKSKYCINLTPSYPDIITGRAIDMMGSNSLCISDYSPYYEQLDKKNIFFDYNFILNNNITNNSIKELARIQSNSIHTICNIKRVTEEWIDVLKMVNHITNEYYKDLI